MKASPGFTFEYPFGSRKAGLDYPGEVMKMKTLGDIKFSAYVGEIPANMPLKDFGPKIYARELENVGSQINIIAHKAITLACGTTAYRTDIKWIWQNAMPEGGMASCLFSIMTDDCDKSYEQAVNAGAEPLSPPQDHFWGMRSAIVKDPYGYRWSFGQLIEAVAPEELAKRAEAYFSAQGG